MAEYASDILFSIDTALQLKNGLNAETITTPKVLTYQDSTFQALKNVTGSLDVTLPSPKSGCNFWIKSRASSTSNIVVKDHNAATVQTLAAGNSVLVACDDSAWYNIVVG
tara:strand:+ start:427 stop:756 length:330 start_codon:yes stop_codon:yes gene_type:complete